MNGYWAKEQAEPQNIGRPEYSIYVYHYPESIEDGRTDWEMKSVTNNLQRALSVARKLHESQDYQCVEVKKKYIDSRYDRVIDRTYKVLKPSDISILPAKKMRRQWRDMFRYIRTNIKGKSSKF